MRIRKNNSTYSKTDRRIIAAAARVFRRRHHLTISAKEISREAGIASSSFYIHYHSLAELIDKNESKIIDGIKKILRKKNISSDSLEDIFRSVLFFLYKNRDLIEIIIDSECLAIQMKVMDTLRPHITRAWLSYKSEVMDRLFHLVSFSFVAEISIWKKENFSVDTILRHAHRLAVMSESIPRLFVQLYYK